MSTWVLLRGLARESRHWGDFPALLGQCLPPADRVLAIDLPGNGARCGEDSPASIDGLLQAVRSQVHGAGGGPFVVVGLSLGGMVALHWAARAPQELRGCVLVNTSAPRLSPPWQRLRPGCYADLLQCLMPWTPRRQRETAVWRMTSARAADAAVLDAWVALARSCPVRAANVLRQVLAATRFRAPGRITVPALVLAGGADRLVSPRCSAALAQAWQLPLRVHPQAGHDLPLDAPLWLADEIARWHAGLAGR